MAETKFYTFSQNNSGGYFIEDLENGVCEYVIVEAASPDDAKDRLYRIGAKTPNFHKYCSCCGERWQTWIDEEDGTPVPMIYDTPVEESESGMFREKAFVHYFDGTFKLIKLKAKSARA
jgi:hypothetical protein